MKETEEPESIIVWICEILSDFSEMNRALKNGGESALKTSSSRNAGGLEEDALLLPSASTGSLLSLGGPRPQCRTGNRLPL